MAAEHHRDSGPGVCSWPVAEVTTVKLERSCRLQSGGLQRDRCSSAGHDWTDPIAVEQDIELSQVRLGLRPASPGQHQPGHGRTRPGVNRQDLLDRISWQAANHRE
jgi:hypothetical protein